MESGVRMAVVVVTGAQKGIGRAIVEGLLERWPEAVVYLTGRNVSAGEEVVAELRAHFSAAHARLHFHELDVLEDTSCARLAAHLHKAHGGLDVLVNNAGCASHDTAWPEPQGPLTLATNYGGVKRVSHHLSPLLRAGARVVNVCSALGTMSGRGYASFWIEWLHTARSEADIDAFAEAYLAASAVDQRKQCGFPESAYRVSKAAAIALTGLQARQLRARNVTVNACCPGFTCTAMTRFQGDHGPAEAAQEVLHLVLAPDLPSGHFFRNRKIAAWP